MEFGELVCIWIIENSDNTGLDNRGSTVLRKYRYLTK